MSEKNLVSFGEGCLEGALTFLIWLTALAYINQFLIMNFPILRGTKTIQLILFLIGVPLLFVINKVIGFVLRYEKQ